MLEQEPPDPDDPILKLDNVILAPHALCWTDQCFAGNGAADVAAVLDVQHGRVPRGVVNRDVLDDRGLDEAAGGLSPAASATEQDDGRREDGGSAERRTRSRRKRKGGVRT